MDEVSVEGVRIILHLRSLCTFVNKDLHTMSAQPIRIALIDDAGKSEVLFE